MSERTKPALAKWDQLAAALQKLPTTSDLERLNDDSDALRRAIAAFHMEAIRFRMFNVDRGLRQVGDPPDARHVYEELRHELEAAGFHTRSHAAPETKA